MGGFSNIQNPTSPQPASVLVPQRSGFALGPHWFARGASGTFTTTALDIVAFPLFAPERITVDRAVIEVTTLQAASLARIALYTSVNYQPGLLLVETANFATTATGILTQTITATSLARGWYWVTVTSDTSAVAFRSMPAASSQRLALASDPASINTAPGVVSRAGPAFGTESPADESAQTYTIASGQVPTVMFLNSAWT
ncbi:MAG: hypothetical protein L0271_00225 [Gemmatimonadetes bacterium]|nr:hypothetical protein [Gemmatimonadota bacterium]